MLIAVRADMPNSASPILIVHPSETVLGYFQRVISGDGAADVVCRRTFDRESIQSGAFRLLIVWEEAKVDKERTFLEFIASRPLPSPVIVISNEGSPRNAVLAVRAGAADYLAADANPEMIIEGVRHAATAADDSGGCQRGGKPRARMISRSDVMRQLMIIAERVAVSDATILIHGESGTGKELLARYIHEASDRGNREMVAMNCAALPEQLAESELFGYEKGSFTGAIRKKSGRFRQADKGTLLLDEISEMPLALQAKLLRVLQEKMVDPVGGHAPVPVNVRVIVTSNRDLREMVATGSFREDLYFRINVVPLQIPPLRDRREDIALLADHFISSYGPRNGKPDARFDKAAISALQAHAWPGNVRELENAVLRAVLISPSETIGPQSLLLDGPVQSPSDNEKSELVGLTVQEVERELISQTLTHVNQNRTHAAKMLGISIRTLRNKLNGYRDQLSTA
jgi:two-component system response regulator FlrC